MLPGGLGASCLHQRRAPRIKGCGGHFLGETQCGPWEQAGPGPSAKPLRLFQGQGLDPAAPDHARAHPESKHSRHLPGPRGQNLHPKQPGGGCQAPGARAEPECAWGRAGPPRVGAPSPGAPGHSAVSVPRAATTPATPWWWTGRSMTSTCCPAASSTPRPCPSLVSAPPPRQGPWQPRAPKCGAGPRQALLNLLAG